MFCTCGQLTEQYHIINPKGTKVVSSVKYSDLKPTDVVRKIKKSKYQQLLKIYKKVSHRFIDEEFPPDHNSLGFIQGLKTCRWCRISEIVPYPKLFENGVHLRDIAEQNGSNCYFLSALIVLAQNPRLITNSFGDQKYNQLGIYKVIVSNDGILEQIFVDQYVPVNAKNQPLFCQPNKSQFWMLILEKVWAKINSSYSSIINGTPSQILRALTFAPVQSLVVPLKDFSQQRKLWITMISRLKQQYPTCAETRSSIDSQQLEIAPSSIYTVTDIIQLVSQDNSLQQVIQLRDSWSPQPKDHKWSFKVPKNQKNSGLFYLPLKIFCENFQNVFYCLSRQNSCYIYQPVFITKKASLFQLVVHKKQTYSIQCHQQNLRKSSKDKQQDGYGRCSLVLIKKTPLNKKNYELQFVDGCLTEDESNTFINLQLEEGQYLVYIKIFPTHQMCLLPQKATLSVYSKGFAQLHHTEQKKYPQFLQKAFTSYSKYFVKKKQEGIEIAWKLLYKKGGFGFISLKVLKDSRKYIQVKLLQENFRQYHFKLKKPHKNKQSQILVIRPGEQTIIIARVQNQEVKSLKFPPPVDIKIKDL